MVRLRFGVWLEALDSEIKKTYRVTNPFMFAANEFDL
jgi:hypothetical protein